jgi:signal peptidase II
MAVFWAVTALTFALDRITKLLAEAHLSVGARTVLLPALLELRLTHNTGIALGLFSGMPILIIVLPVLAMAFGWLALRRYRFTAFNRVATALLMGGFLGNLADRLLTGFVPDMVFFPWMPWYICNAADVAITFGVALLAVSLLFRPGDWTLKTEGKPDGINHADRAA